MPVTTPLAAAPATSAAYSPATPPYSPATAPPPREQPATAVGMDEMASYSG
ncbi:hypothetical protein H7H82_01005 [Mycobacterium heidelbergense]|nr:hypothetical protein [Mycobacterium heidelbergense]MCV7049200.1 hypothetical protein [Mycobacterium heidelbergense]